MKITCREQVLHTYLRQILTYGLFGELKAMGSDEICSQRIWQGPSPKEPDAKEIRQREPGRA